MGAAAPGSGPSDGPDADGEHSLAATNSPWLTQQTFDAEMLPSAFATTGVEQPLPPPPEEVATGPSKGGNALMTVGLAVAAVALIGVIVYFAMADSGHSEDPTKVNVEQRDYADAPQSSATSAPSVSAKPRPVRVIRKAPPPPPPPAKAEDIYEDL